MMSLNSIIFFAMLFVGVVMIVYSFIFKRHIVLFTTIGAIFFGIGLMGFLYPTIIEAIYENMDNHPPLGF